MRQFFLYLLLSFSGIATLLLTPQANAQTTYFVTNFGNFNDGSDGSVTTYDGSGVFQSSFAPVQSAHDVLIRNDGRILVSNHYGGVVDSFNTDGTGGSVLAGPGTLRGATGITFDGLNRLYVVDQFGGNIFRYNPDGSGGITWASGLAGPNRLAFHNGVAFLTEQASGNIRLLDLNGNLTGTFATGFAGPVGIAFDNLDRVYVSDYFGGLVRRFNADGSGGTNILTGLLNPHGLVISADQKLYIAEEDANRVLRTNLDGSGVTSFITGLNHPVQIAILDAAVLEPGSSVMLMGITILGATLLCLRRRSRLGFRVVSSGGALMNAPRIFCLITAFTAATGLLTPGNAVSAQTYTAAAGFSPTSNPSGTWSYGYSATRGGPYSYFTVHGSFAADGTGAPLDYWSAAVPESGPNVVHNATGAPQILGGTAAMNPDALVIGAGGDYIGPTNVYAVARFIVPSTAAYALNVLFEGIQIAPTCSNGTTTDVHILLNGGSLFSGAVNGWVGRPYVASPPMGSAPSQSYTSVLALAAGDTVDFAIGNSGNGSSCDGTQLSAQLVTQQPSAVPEPSATAFGVSVAAFSLVLLRYRTARK